MLDFSSNKQVEPVSDAELVRRCLAGEAAAFESLYRQHATRLYNLAWRMSGTEAEAQDLLQEIFLQAYRKLKTFRGDAALGTWLYRIGVNLCLDRVRSRQGRMDQVTDPLEVEGRPQTAEPTSLADDPVERIDLERAIQLLPPSYRAAFLLHDVEGFEHREVGELLGIAEGSSKSLLHKARLRLRELLS